MDQQTDDQYNTALWTNRTPTRQIKADHLAFGAKESLRATSLIGVPMNVHYGETDRETMDIFGAEVLPGDAPILVYIHGGCWQSGSKESYGFLAIPFVKAGALLVILEYDIAPHVTMSKMVEQTKRGIGHVLQMAKTRKSKGVYLCGHSAGAHLACMTLADEQQRAALQEHIKGALLISGVYDLRPICRTSGNEAINMTESEAWDNSVTPVIEAVSQTCKGAELVFAVGQVESAEFKRQSIECKQALESRGTKVKYIEVGDRDHFTIVENMLQSEYQLTQEALRLMNL